MIRNEEVRIAFRDREGPPFPVQESPVQGMTFMDWRGTDPDILTLHYHSKNIGGWNMGWFKDPVIDKLLDDGREEMNRAKRHKIYEEAQKYVMEQAATIPLFNQVQPDVAVAAVKGLAFDANNYFILYDVWLER
jgi:peptide/nickel transport system substrate-binding protein